MGAWHRGIKTKEGIKEKQEYFTLTPSEKKAYREWARKRNIKLKRRFVI